MKSMCVEGVLSQLLKAEKANMGILGIQSSSLSSPARCREILRCLQRAEQDCKGEERPLVFLQGESQTLPFCSAAIYPWSNHGKLTPWLEDGLAWKEAYVRTGGELFADIPASFAVLKLVVLLGNRTKCFFILGLQ